MAPDGFGAVLALAGATVLAAILLGILWDAVSGWRRVPVRAVAVLLSLVTAAGTAGIWLNGQTQTYTTWSSLLSGRVQDDQPTAPEQEPPPGPPSTAPTTLASAPAPSGSVPSAPVPAVQGASRIVSFTLVGKASGMSLPAYAYLPPGYDLPAQRTTRYPVIEALHGFPGSPRTWLQRLDAQARLDREIAAGRMAPTVVVFPFQTPDALVDTECVDLANGPKAETYLTVDVPAVVMARFRVRTDRGGWGLIGYSAGGFCAANLLLRHPDRYAAGAGLSGYADPGIVIGDGTESTSNNVAWRLKHLPVPPVALYLVCAGDDRHAMRDAERIAGLVRAPMTLTTGRVSRGGHSQAAWRSMMAPAFDWLSARLARPAAGGVPGVTSTK
jgi:S-formylglutathione hydrolase FrmB